MKTDKADSTFAEAIKTRDKWTCQRCKTDYTHSESKQGLDCSHYFGRQAQGTRFEPDNCIALCRGCHNYWDEIDKEGYREFKTKQLGQERFESLRLQANTYKKKDYKMRLIEAREYLKLMEKYERQCH